MSKKIGTVKVVKKGKAQVPAPEKIKAPAFVRTLSSKEFAERFVVPGKPLPEEARKFATPGMWKYWTVQREEREAQAKEAKNKTPKA